jgi:hypothetical protein
MESLRSTNLMNQTSPQIVEPNSSVAYSYRPDRGPYLGSHCKLDPYRMTRHAIGGVCDPFSLLPPFDFLLSRPRWRSASLLFLHRLVTSSPTSGAPPLRPHPPPIGRPWMAPPSPPNLLYTPKLHRCPRNPNPNIDLGRRPHH